MHVVCNGDVFVGTFTLEWYPPRTYAGGMTTLGHDDVPPPSEHRLVRDTTIKLRLSTDEHEAWQAAALASGLTLSDWVRQRCNGPAALPPAATQVKRRG